MKIIITLCALLLLCTHATAALFTRDLDGNPANGHEGVYDDVLDITWLADGSLAETNAFDISSIYLDGRMSWPDAESFVSQMNAFNGGAGYLGINNWRQPKAEPVNGSSFDLRPSYDGSTDVGLWISGAVDPIYNPVGQSEGFENNELAHHYYNNFGAIAVCNSISEAQGDCVSTQDFGMTSSRNTENINLFNNIKNEFYWTGTLVNSQAAFFFEVSIGAQDTLPIVPEDFLLYVWPVFDGDANAVPIPAAAWLFGSGLIGLALARRRNT